MNGGPIRYIRDVSRMMCRYWNLLFLCEQLPRPFMHIGANGKHTVHGTNIQQSDVSTSNTEADFPSDW